MRRWWDGETISGDWEGLVFDEVKLEPLPKQQPLEIWLGGIRPSALERVAQIADGWLTSAATPQEAGAGRATILARAAELGRVVDEEHFGISVPFSVEPPPDSALELLRKRRKDRDLSEIVPIGSKPLRTLLNAHIDRFLWYNVLSISIFSFERYIQFT